MLPPLHPAVAQALLTMQRQPIGTIDEMMNDPVMGFAMGATNPQVRLSSAQLKEALAAAKQVRALVQQAIKRGETPVPFEHRSPVEGIKTLTSRFMGTGRPGAEARRPKRPPTLHVQDVGSRVEPEFHGMPAYTVQVPPSLLYDIAADPKGIVRAHFSKRPGDLDGMERAILKNGFAGYYNGDVPETKKLFGDWPAQPGVPKKRGRK